MSAWPARLRVVAGLLVGLLVWWSIEDTLLKGWWLMADALWPTWMGLADSGRVDTIDTGWRVHTGWVLADLPDRRALLLVDERNLHKLVGGFGLMLALVLATPRPGWAKVLWALGLQWVACFIGLSAWAWHLLVTMAGHRTSFVDPSIAPAPQALAVPVPADWVFVFSGYAAYVSMLVLPLLLPLLIWGSLHGARLAGWAARWTQPGARPADR